MSDVLSSIAKMWKAHLSLQLCIMMFIHCEIMWDKFFLKCWKIWDTLFSYELQKKNVKTHNHDNDEYNLFGFYVSLRRGVTTFPKSLSDIRKTYIRKVFKIPERTFFGYQNLLAYACMLEIRNVSVFSS